jgi:hypothetical protein
MASFLELFDLNFQCPAPRNAEPKEPVREGQSLADKINKLPEQLISKSDRLLAAE